MDEKKRSVHFVSVIKPMVNVKALRGHLTEEEKPDVSMQHFTAVHNRVPCVHGKKRDLFHVARCSLVLFVFLKTTHTPHECNSGLRWGGVGEKAKSLVYSPLPPPPLFSLYLSPYFDTRKLALEPLSPPLFSFPSPLENESSCSRRMDDGMHTDHRHHGACRLLKKIPYAKVLCANIDVIEGYGDGKIARNALGEKNASKEAEVRPTNVALLENKL